MKKKLLFVVCLLISQWSIGQTATFQVNYNYFSPQAQAAFDQAVQNWENILVSPVPIKINAYMIDGTGLGFLGLTISNGARNFPNAPQNDVWYSSCLADALAGQDMNPNDSDIDIFLDSTRAWYYGFDANPPTSQFDYIDVVMHEIGHGLGFFSAANIDNNNIGSYSLIVDPVIDILASFTIPDLEKQPFVWDTFIENNFGAKITDTTAFVNPSASLSSAYRSNNLFFNGANASGSNNGNPIRVYAPSTFAFGSSFLHLNESSYLPGTPDAMMTPFTANGEAIHFPGPITLGVLMDLGWSINFTATERWMNEIFTLNQNFPNPFTYQTNINYELKEKGLVSLKVYDITGRLVHTLVDEEQGTGSYSYQWNGENANGQPVSNGMYIYQLRVGDRVISKKMMIQR